jgi:SAM-dependent methyltransferase
MDKTSPEYWTSFWKHYKLPEPIDVKSNDLGNYPNRRLHEFFSETFSTVHTSGKRILELGCGNSVFLSYFKAEFQFDIYGIDYSELGCEQTRKILDRDNIKGEIIYADIFNPPTELLNSFDVVCSFGVAEHFDDTNKALAAFSRFLKPGGMLITTIPNMAGLTGILQKFFYKEVYDVHRILSKEQFGKCFDTTGLKLQYCEYAIPVSFGVTLDPVENHVIKFRAIKKLIVKLFQVLEKLAWIIDEKLFKLPKTTFLSGAIFTVATKPLAK